MSACVLFGQYWLFLLSLKCTCFTLSSTYTRSQWRCPHAMTRHASPTHQTTVHGRDIYGRCVCCNMLRVLCPSLNCEISRHKQLCAILPLWCCSHVSCLTEARGTHTALIQDLFVTSKRIDRLCPICDLCPICAECEQHTSACSAPPH